MKKGIVSWFAHNTVAANLVMIVIIAGGVLVLPFLKKEIFPEYAVDIITVQVRYLGAAPEEVEEGVCVRVEEEIQDLDGIKQIRSVAAEGGGTVTVEVVPGYDSRKLLDDVKARVDAIDTFPEQTEKPVVQELTNRFQVMNVSISGDADELTLKRLGEQVRDELIALPGVTQVELTSARPYEISIELSEEAMRRHGLTFDDVATAVRRSSLDLPGGSIKTRTGEILLRTKGQAYRGPEFAELTLFTKPDGTRLRLGDVARVVDGFAETDQWSRLNGKRGVMVQVFRVGEQNALDVADTVREYVAGAQLRMPDGIDLTIWQDNSEFLRGRMDLLLRNAVSGLLLVFVVLALFLRMRLAFWVTIGIPISFLGAIAMM
ncbi:MAG: efflux RND transporter permease subunit, partial [bacterium]|nr:efflux RND transporter permease subunit [bacterium]